MSPSNVEVSKGRRTMKEKNRRVYDRIVSERARRLGISEEEAAVPQSNQPLHEIAAVERGKELGLTAAEVLRRDIESLRRSQFPTADCLTPDEVQDYSETKVLTERCLQHLTSCEACTGLLAATEPPIEHMKSFYEEVRQMLVVTVAQSSCTEQEDLESSPIDTELAHDR